MRHSILIPTREDVCLRQAIFGHGWYDLLPFRADAIAGTLETTVTISGRVLAIRIADSDEGIEVRHGGRAVDSRDVERIVRHILRLDEDLSDFYSRMPERDELSWVVSARAGRLLRSPTVFEDLVKTMCTTNCSWSLTRLMVSRLVESLGEKGPNGHNAFPTAEMLATKDEAFFRNEIKAGYRSPYLMELCDKVASGELDPEKWLANDLPTAELKKQIKEVKGIGDYAAENLLKLLGRYDGLALDSWLRAGFYKKRNRGRKCSDKKIEKHYAKFNEWRGLAIWCDMTEDWFAEPPDN